MLKSIQTVFTAEDQPQQSSQTTTKPLHQQKKPLAGHYLNYHTKQNLKKKRKFAQKGGDEEGNNNNKCTLTYNFLYIPRILKNDLRRQYPVMFMNVFNSCDYQFMMKFIDKFLADNVQFILEAPGKSINPLSLS